jgi:DNA-binding NarL/FixJ family response regulator
LKQSPVQTQEAPATAAVIVLADDLIWASRLSAAVQRAGAEAVAVRSADRLSAALESAADGAVVIVDLSGRAYDGVDAILAAVAAGATVLAVGQHEDLPLRRRALAAGARRVLSYNKLFSDGPQVVGALLRGEF